MSRLPHAGSAVFAGTGAAAWRQRIERLNSSLLPELPSLAPRWLPTGRLAGAEWTAINPLRADRRTGSFRVNVRNGRWADFATGERGGDPVSLYAYLFTSGRQGAAARALEGNGWRENSIAAPCPAKAAKVANLDADEAARVERAGAIYAAAPPVAGAAETYLRGRGLLRCSAWEPLRAAHLRYPAHGRHAALVAPVTSPGGTVEGVQRTFVTLDGHKLDVPDPKLSLGRIRGGAIRLGPPAGELILCEGLEDGLTLAQELPGASVWAAPGAGMLASMHLPLEVASVLIAADNDAAGDEAASRAADVFTREGRQVRIMRPDPAFKDWNDQLRGFAR